MEKKKNYFGIYNSWDKYDEKLRKDVRKDLACDYDIDESDVSEEMIDERFDLCLDDEESNLNVSLNGYTLFAFGTLGLWNGKPTAYKILGEDNLGIFLRQNYGGEENEIFCDKYNVRVRSSHHDGTNCFVIRMVETSKVERLISDIWNCKIKNEKQLFRRTKSLRPMVADVYGWKQYGRQKKG